MNPGISIPDRKKWQGCYWTKFMTKRNSNLFRLLKGTLCIDGSSNATSNPVIGVAICTKGKTYLSDVIDTTGVPHTAEKLYDICEAQIKKCKGGK